MSNHAPVLVAEDDPNDVFLLRRAFQKVGIFNSIVVAHNGQEAIDYLSGHGPYRNRSSHPFPALLFLDLKMPLVDGFDVLTWLNHHRLEQSLPVVILSSSNQERDIERAQQMGASDYCVKPQQFEELVEIVKRVREKWLTPDLRT